MLEEKEISFLIARTLPYYFLSINNGRRKKFKNTEYCKSGQCNVDLIIAI